MHKQVNAGAVVAALICLAALGAPAWSAEHFVQVSGFSFTPSNLSIEVGDTVTWTNNDGFHNVLANDNSFRCANGCDGQGGNGNPASNWSFSRVFNNPGTIDYHCEVHGLSMSGRLTVVTGAPDMPGTLSFAQATRQVGEDEDSVTLIVNRASGDDGAVSVSYASANGSAADGSDYDGISGTLSWADNDDDSKTISVPILDDGADEANEAFTVALSSPTGGAGLGSPSIATVTIVDNDSTAPSPGFLAFVSTLYTTGENGGGSVITLSRSGGSDGAVSVSYATSDGSASAGSDYTAASGTVSWGNGDSANKTFGVPILDDSEIEGDETINLMLSNPTGGAGLGANSSATLAVTDDDQEPSGECVPDAETLCLGVDGRFRVRVHWRDFADREGEGRAVDIGRRDSGLVYFFNEDNIEMLIKVLNACNDPDFHSYWVFFAATTNVEFAVTVTDTQSNVPPKVYTNALGNAAAPVLDTAAFATCP